MHCPVFRPLGSVPPVPRAGDPRYSRDFVSRGGTDPPPVFSPPVRRGGRGRFSAFPPAGRAPSGFFGFSRAGTAASRFRFPPVQGGPAFLSVLVSVPVLAKSRSLPSKPGSAAPLPVPFVFPPPAPPFLSPRVLPPVRVTPAPRCPRSPRGRFFSRSSRGRVYSSRGPGSRKPSFPGLTPVLHSASAPGDPPDPCCPSPVSLPFLPWTIGGAR